MTETVSATYAKNNFAEILNRVAYSDAEFVVEKQGKPVAMIAKSREPGGRRILPKGLSFVLELSKIKAQGAPKDFAKNLDKYLWGKHKI